MYAVIRFIARYIKKPVVGQVQSLIRHSEPGVTGQLKVRRRVAVQLHVLVEKIPGAIDHVSCFGLKGQGGEGLRRRRVNLYLGRPDARLEESDRKLTIFRWFSSYRFKRNDPRLLRRVSGLTACSSGIASKHSCSR